MWKGWDGCGLFAILPNPGRSSSQANTICHHSHLESAASTGRWEPLTGTDCYRRVLVEKAGFRTHTHTHTPDPLTICAEDLCVQPELTWWWRDGAAVTHGCSHRLRALTAPATLRPPGDSSGWTRGCGETLLEAAASTEQDPPHTPLIGEPAPHPALR